MFNTQKSRLNVIPNTSRQIVRVVYERYSYQVQYHLVT